MFNAKPYRIDNQVFIAQGKQQPGAEARAVAAYLVQDDEKLSLTELGRYLNRDISALSRSATRLRARKCIDQDLVGRLKAIETELKIMSTCHA